jgi:hypothetical protein
MKLKLLIAGLVLLALSAAASAQFMTLHAGSAANGGSVSSCTGTVDLSTGCAQPMLGGA